MKNHVFTTTEYTKEHATFLGLSPIYFADNEHDFQIGYSAKIHRASKFSTLIGLSLCDRKYKLFLDDLINRQIIVSDSDVIAHDCYIEKLRKNQTIVLYFSDLKTSPSKKRILNAVKRIRSKGFRVNYFTSKENAENFVSKKLSQLDISAAKKYALELSEAIAC